jgi:hypothetical protein
MKRLISNILLLSIVSIVLFGCKKDETKAVANTSASAGAQLTASQSTLVLTRANQTQTAVTFNLTKPNFGFDAAPTNILQIAKKGTNFVNAKEVTIDAKGTSKTYTVLDFNALMLSMGLATGVQSDVDARIVSKLSENVAPVFSNIVSLKVTPYALISYLYTVGDFQGWNINNVDSLVSATSNGIYTGIIDYRNSGSKAFLIVTAKSFNNKYADAGPGKIQFNNGGDLIAPNNFQYRVTADINLLTISYVRDSWGVIGDATPTGWGGDTKMKYNNGTRKWSITINLEGGKFIKFRQNDDWSLPNYGSKNNNGTLDTQNDNNIPITITGSYRLEADFSNLTYSVVKL